MVNQGTYTWLHLNTTFHQFEQLYPYFIIGLWASSQTGLHPEAHPNKNGGQSRTVTRETQNFGVKTPLTFLFDGGGVDRDEAAACRMAGPQYVLADLARDAREGRGDKAEGRAGLHDRPRAARLDG